MASVAPEAVYVPNPPFPRAVSASDPAPFLRFPHSPLTFASIRICLFLGNCWELKTMDRGTEIKAITLFVIGTFLIVGCAAPVSHTNIPVSTYDKDTEYGIEPRDDGFGITVYYSRYQFIPESDSVAIACKSQLTAIAWEYAEKIGREIEPINEQRIRISMGRNALSGITSCQAFAIAKWRGPR